MTAFASTKIEGEWGRLIWEIRTVNHRYLDLNFRLPEIFNAKEMKFREVLCQSLQRGKVECSLRYVAGHTGKSELIINHQLITTLHQAGGEIATLLEKQDNLSVKDVMRWPGSVEIKACVSDELHEAALQSLTEAVTKLVEVRQGEGGKLSHYVLDRNHQLNDLLIKAKKLQQGVVNAARDKLLTKIMQFDVSLDEYRLEQEVVLAVQRLDVSEELDRLEAHIAEFARLIEQKGVIGRRLDFLLQEFNREANTLASKSNQTALTNIAVEMKVLIEQMREQVQNIE